MTIELESEPMTRVLQEESDDDLSNYPWRSGAEAVILKAKFPHKSIDEIRRLLSEESFPKTKKRKV